MTEAVGYDLSLQDYRRHFRYLNFHMFRGKVLFRAALIALLMLVAPPLVGTRSLDPDRLAAAYRVGWPIFLGGVAVILALVLWVAPEMGARRVFSVHQPGPRRASPVAEGLRFAAPSGEALLRWDAMERIVTTDHAVLFVLTKGRMMADCRVVPRSAFPTEAGFDAFVAEARRLWREARPTQS